MTITRPALRWHGGKYRLAPWIIAHFPDHRVYVEPFGGAASVLLRKPRSYGEVYNDLDSELVTLFRVLRNPPMAASLRELLLLTPFARQEFQEAYQPSDDVLETCRRLIIRSYMGFGSDGTRADLSTGFRANSNRSGTTPAHDWKNYPDAMKAITERMQGVVIENRDAIACMVQHDGPDTLHYVDPPYVPETRSLDHRRHGYKHELDQADHERLLAEMLLLRGMVVLSGYAHASYDDTLKGWRRVDRMTYADGARPRQECLWINQAASDRHRDDLPLLGREAAA